MTFELQLDDSRQREASCLVRDHRMFAGDGPARPQPPQPPRDGRGGAANLLGELVSRLHVILLEARQEPHIEPVQLICQGPTPICQILASPPRCLSENANQSKR